MMEFDGRPVTPDTLGPLSLYNYGHFTSIRVEDLRVRGLSLHMERLARDCRTLFDAELDVERVRHLARRVTQNVTSPVIVRITIFDPDLELGHPGGRAEPHILVSTRSAATGALSSLRLRSVHYERDLPTVKHVGLLGTLYHRRAAQLDGFDDALFTDSNSQISEGATWNIGFIDQERVYWPKSEVLPGVTMHLVRHIIANIGMTSATVPLSLAQVPEMQSAFVTNVTVGVRPIRSIDNVQLSDDAPVLEIVRQNYEALPGEAL
jgi:branched-subunit amino acid aminotransferase/4-amino-4-deoxychorismate lyase